MVDFKRAEPQDVDPADTKYCRNVEKDEFREYLRRHPMTRLVEAHGEEFSVIQFVMDGVLMAQAVYLSVLDETFYQVRREAQ